MLRRRTYGSLVVWIDFSRKSNAAAVVTPLSRAHAPALPYSLDYPSWFFPQHFSFAARSLLSGLLHPDASCRLSVRQVGLVRGGVVRLQSLRCGKMARDELRLLNEQVGLLSSARFSVKTYFVLRVYGYVLVERILVCCKLVPVLCWRRRVGRLFINQQPTKSNRVCCYLLVGV